MNNKVSNGGKVVRLGLSSLLVAALVGGISIFNVQTTSANHPVLVEGNCDSPVPGTTIVERGTCGDYDGDGRIGTAEDTDGADRIFGTLAAAIGPGTGAAAGTGANHNGRITIVASGRFAEQLLIGQPVTGFTGGVATSGNTTIEAAPGVEANIDAILQGDPAGGNNTRTTQPGILINQFDATRSVTLRNLSIRNWDEGVRHIGNGRLVIDNCRFEGNLNFGIRMLEATQNVITNTYVTGTGRRTGVGAGTLTAGNGIQSEGAAQVRVSDSTVSHSVGVGLSNATGGPFNFSVFHTRAYFNNPNTAGAIESVQTDGLVME